MKEAERELEPFRQLRPTARRLRTIKLNLAAIRGLFTRRSGCCFARSTRRSSSACATGR